MVFRQAIENDCRHRELLVLHVLDVSVQREQTMLSVNSPKNAFAFWHLETPDRRSGFDGFECQFFVARDNDGASDRWQIPRLTTLLVVLNQFVDLSPDDLPLIGLFARGDTAF